MVLGVLSLGVVRSGLVLSAVRSYRRLAVILLFNIFGRVLVKCVGVVLFCLF